ncbi:HNH endonuclease signature motif containing protein [Acidovorax sp. RAC01]|uniref:HNH endonuclease signature motif containing protein n=1 Tax=Acidovorax sp. RAC01 TaxID=1842533 RepID=UPI00083E875D|nr:HNH endonuclease signature motif containing protein [Acidovorax sp. RAC01]AOG25256.1 AP2 domain protein [Acidovorax sp. RAC01]
MATANLTAQRLRELLNYDPETGIFTWKVNAGRWGRIKAGTETGSPDLTGHLRIQVDGTLYYAHRLAWLMQTGAWPLGDVDHMDGVPGNNRWRNLRDVPHQTNAENRRKAHRNKQSGLPMGVSIDKRDGGIRADITVNGRARSLGRFDDPEQAHAAYLKAKRELHSGCTI